VDADAAIDLEDRYRHFSERRRSTPVRWRSATAPSGMGPVYDVYRYDDCLRVLRDPQTFSSGVYADSLDRVLGRTIIGMDDPEHEQHRDLVAHVFRQRALAPWADELIRPACHELIERFRPTGRADLVADLSLPLPIAVTARILGLPLDDDARFHRWSLGLIEMSDDMDRGLAASTALREYFSGIVRERRRSPRHDVISKLIAAEVDGVRLKDEAICSLLRLLLPAGVETTACSLVSLIRRLLAHPDQLDAVRRDRALVPQTIEEGLRYDAPSDLVARMATSDCGIGGVPVPAGSMVIAHLASANRDERRWIHADRFDIHRPALRHLSFGAGPHMCLGLHLARLESEVALNAVLDRLPGLRQDADRPALRVRVRSNGMAVLDSLPVVFDV
jgi:cytochrome P450